MVQYNQYIDPETDKKITLLCEAKKKELGKKHYSKTDMVLELLRQALKEV